MSRDVVDVPVRLGGDRVVVTDVPARLIAHGRSNVFDEGCR